MSGPQTYNPITQEVGPLVPNTNYSTLQCWCRKTIAKTLLLKNLHKIESLPLPSSMKPTLLTLHLSDFVIGHSTMPPESHVTHIYPATCLLTDTQVNLRMVDSDDHVNKDDLKFLATFVEDGHTFIVEEQTRTLTQVIQQTKADNSVMQEQFLWLLLNDLVQYIIEEQVPPTTHVSADCIHFLPKNQIYIEIDTDSHTNNMPEPSAAVTEAPEVINHNNPDSRALVWSVGCILYEALALEPAYYDPSGTNPFMVYMNITNGILPREPYVNEELKSVLRKCLVHDVSKRVTMETLHGIIKCHLK